jgi:tetratricopeptide (TPR) repeat protein
MEMGNKALAGEKYDLAIEYFQSAIDDNPDCWQAYVGLGNCYYYKKKLQDSLKAYEKALKINPDNSELTRFIRFLKTKLGVAAAPTPTPTVGVLPLPGLPPLPPGGVINPPPK